MNAYQTRFVNVYTLLVSLLPLNTYAQEKYIEPIFAGENLEESTRFDSNLEDKMNLNGSNGMFEVCTYNGPSLKNPHKIPIKYKWLFSHFRQVSLANFGIFLA